MDGCACTPLLSCMRLSSSPGVYYMVSSMEYVSTVSSVWMGNTHPNGLLSSGQRSGTLYADTLRACPSFVMFYSTSFGCLESLMGSLSDFPRSPGVIHMLRVYRLCLGSLMGGYAILHLGLQVGRYPSCLHHPRCGTHLGYPSSHLWTVIFCPGFLVI